MNRWIAIDPGSSKCGLVLADADRDLVIKGQVVPKDDVLQILSDWCLSESPKQILIGDGTGSQAWMESLRRFGAIRRVPEQGTTLRARQRYWELWPASGWRRLLPSGMRIPPCPLDAVAALVILEDVLGRQLIWPGPRPVFTVRTSPGR